MKKTAVYVFCLALSLFQHSLFAQLDLEFIRHLLAKKDFEQAKIQIDDALVRYDGDSTYNQYNLWFMKGLVYDFLLRENKEEKNTALYADMCLRAYKRSIIEGDSNRREENEEINLRLNSLYNVLINKGIDFHKTKEFRYAIRYYTLAHYINPHDSVAIRYAFVAAKESQDKNLQKNNALHMIRHNAYQKEALQLLQDLYTQENNIEKIQLFTKELKARNPKDTSLIFAEVNQLVHFRLISEAIHKMHTLHEANPKNKEIIKNLAVLHMQTRQIYEAEKYFLKFIEIDSTSFEVSYTLASMFYNEGQKLSDYQKNKLSSDKKKGKILMNPFYEKSAPYLIRALALRPQDRNLLNASSVVDTYLRKSAKRAKKKDDIVSSPKLTIQIPTDTLHFQTNKPFIIIEGIAHDDEGITEVTANGIIADLEENERFKVQVPLKEGENHIIIQTLNFDEQLTQKTLKVYRQSLWGEGKNVLLHIILPSSDEDSTYFPKQYTELLSKTLLQNYKGFQPSDVIVLEKEHTHKDRLHNNLKSIFKKMGANDRLFITISGKSYVEPLHQETIFRVEKNKKESNSNFSFADLSEWIKASKHKHTCFVLDTPLENKNLETFRRSNWLLSDLFSSVAVISPKEASQQKLVQAIGDYLMKANNKGSFSVYDLYLRLKLLLDNQVDMNYLTESHDEGGEMPLLKKEQ